MEETLMALMPRPPQVETSQLEEIPLLAGSQQQVETLQLEEISLLAGSQQQVETLQLEEIPLLAGSQQQVETLQLEEIPQHGRAQQRQIPQHFHPANVWTRVAAQNTTVGANALTSRRTSTGGG